ncbi:MAG: hypothetical protein MRERV_11c001, partial [Mycoplasmataceae bacterium RV_VA103A]
MTIQKITPELIDERISRDGNFKDDQEWVINYVKNAIEGKDNAAELKDLIDNSDDNKIKNWEVGIQNEPKDDEDRKAFLTTIVGYANEVIDFLNGESSGDRNRGTDQNTGEKTLAMAPQLLTLDEVEGWNNKDIGAIWSTADFNSDKKQIIARVNDYLNNISPEYRDLVKQKVDEKEELKGWERKISNKKWTITGADSNLDTIRNHAIKIANGVLNAAYDAWWINDFKAVAVSYNDMEDDDILDYRKSGDNRRATGAEGAIARNGGWLENEIEIFNDGRCAVRTPSGKWYNFDWTNPTNTKAAWNATRTVKGQFTEAFRLTGRLASNVDKIADDKTLEYHKHSTNNFYWITGTQAGKIYNNEWYDPNEIMINDEGVICGSLDGGRTFLADIDPTETTRTAAAEREQQQRNTIAPELLDLEKVQNWNNDTGGRVWNGVYWSNKKNIDADKTQIIEYVNNYLDNVIPNQHRQQVRKVTNDAAATAEWERRIRDIGIIRSLGLDEQRQEAINIANRVLKLAYEEWWISAFNNAFRDAFAGTDEYYELPPGYDYILHFRKTNGGHTITPQQAATIVGREWRTNWQSQEIRIQDDGTIQASLNNVDWTIDPLTTTKTQARDNAKNAWRTAMAGAANGPRNTALAVGGNTGADDTLMDAWFTKTVLGGGNVLDANLTAPNARALWDNNWDAADILINGNNIRVVNPLTGNNVDGFAAIDGLGDKAVLTAAAAVRQKFITDFKAVSGASASASDPDILAYFDKNLTAEKAAELYNGNPRVDGSELEKGANNNKVK